MGEWSSVDQGALSYVHLSVCQEGGEETEACTEASQERSSETQNAETCGGTDGKEDGIREGHEEEGSQEEIRRQEEECAQDRAEVVSLFVTAAGEEIHRGQGP